MHVFVFFIFLVSNIGGALTPLGDPPLFLGFLKGVDFLWTFEAMLLPMLFMSIPLLALFYAIDRAAWARESPALRGATRAPERIRIEGAHNLFYLLDRRADGAGERACGTATLRFPSVSASRCRSTGCCATLC